MRGPLVAATLTAVAGAVFVVAYEPSPAGSRLHDWLAVVCVAATAGVFYAAGTAPRRRLVLVSAAYALFVFTTMAWFVESVLVWVVVGLAIAAAVAAVSRVRRSAALR